ncbi:16S rRNA (guanine(966)-N(2))-methyltransferase RsmD [Devosia rhodophyticola]|uniref:16S rRNA (Guanine(966)-N(2))-methyltransferase RsmD n=1 Tax=Devosia rhodophyticola TaxID=3026423 RepID=A0ABY7YZ15_9HYPH|nr:16S rRNA (guanine(966)-N(2))-methyltransferase RsmD [Devosia rhodophyticola]WDR06606.1 16S rRNA (guanine(966)-N(2))-methyltransferase RsmD [Devosia rhodophyticola]
MRIVSGKFRGRQLISPSDLSIRPTADRVRESLFNILASRLGPNFEGRRVLDLFAGTGALGLEALSRGAAHVTFVDMGTEARGIIRDHIEAFGAGGVTKLLRRDATDLGVPGSIKPFDLVFLDPPYNEGLGETALAGLTKGWLTPAATLAFEESAEAEISLPTGFELIDRRVYGAAAIYLLSYTA